MTQKILANHAGLDQVSAGQLIRAKVDLVLGNDITAPVAIIEFEKAGIEQVFDREKIALVMDHFTPNKDIKAAEQCKVVRTFAKKYQITNFFDVGKVGVEHALLPEMGLVKPGDLIIGADSHTCTYGALGAFSTGVGSTDMAAGMATGLCWLKVPTAIKFVLTGKLKPWVSGKDIILHIIGMTGVDGALYQSMEFTGEGLASLTMEDRLCMANMAIEAGAKNGIFEYDEKTEQFAKEHNCAAWSIYKADADAEYTKTYEIDLSAIEPTVSLPHLPENAKPVSQVGRDHHRSGGHWQLHQRQNRRPPRGGQDLRRPSGTRRRPLHRDPRHAEDHAAGDGRRPREDLHRCGLRREHAYLRAVSRRTHGHPRKRGARGRHHEPKLCRPHGAHGIGSVSGFSRSRRRIRHRGQTRHTRIRVRR